MSASQPFPSKLTKTVDIGEDVFCDYCNEDYSQSDDEGGLLFGSYAACPKCVPRTEGLAKQYGEESHIKSRCPADTSYRDWVLSLRNGDNTIKFYSE